MASEFERILDAILRFLTAQGTISGDEANLLSEIVAKSEARRRQDDEELIKLDTEYLSGSVGFAENLAERKRKGWAELPIDPKSKRRAAKNLLDLGVLVEKEAGVAANEPSHHAPLEILLRRTPLAKLSGRLPQFGKWISGLCTKTGILAPLPNRQSLAQEITAKLPEGSSMVISRSPSIFNPFEFDEGFSNHTWHFANMVARTEIGSILDRAPAPAYPDSVISRLTAYHSDCNTCECNPACPPGILYPLPAPTRRPVL